MNGARKGWIVIGLACAFVVPGGLNAVSAAADEAGPVSISDAVRAAVAWHPSIVEATARLGGFSEQIDVAEAGYRPQITAGVGTGFETIGRSRWRPRANLSATQMLYDFGKVRSEVDFAEAGVELGEAQVLAAVDTLIRDTGYAVLEIRRNEELRRIALDQLQSVSDIGDLVRHRFERGAATRADTLQADARVQAAQATIEEIAAEQERWEAALAHYLGQEEAPELSADLPPGFMQSCERGQPDWNGVPAILEVRAQRDQAQAELARTRAETLPTLSLSAGGTTEIHDPFGGREEYNVGLNLSTALYNGGGNRARVRSAAYAMSAADAAEARIRNEVSRTLSESQRQVASLGRVLDTLAFREDSMSETGSLYRLQYLEMGTKTLVDLLNAEQELHQVRFDRVNTAYDLRRLQVDCLVFSGAARDAFGLAGRAIEGAVL